MSGRRPSASSAGNIASPSWCSTATPRAPNAASASRRWGRSIARPTSGSISTSRFFDDLERRFHVARPVPAGLRDRPRGRPSRPEPSGHQRQDRADEGAHEQARRQCAVGAGRAAGRLLRRRLGQPRRRRARRQDDRRSSDVEQALAAASAIGDDRLQRQAQGRVVPDSFTHGSSAQRMRWFRIGLESGDPKKCDTFSAKQL